MPLLTTQQMKVCPYNAKHMMRQTNIYIHMYSWYAMYDA